MGTTVALGADRLTIAIVTSMVDDAPHAPSEASRCLHPVGRTNRSLSAVAATKMMIAVLAKRLRKGLCWTEAAGAYGDSMVGGVGKGRGGAGDGGGGRGLWGGVAGGGGVGRGTGC